MNRLNLVMIVRNEAGCLARCLSSLRPHVEDMIVMDTGSNDGTQEIARAEGAHVYEFTWCDDFSAARNAALGRSDAAWNLVADADEWLVKGGEALSARTLPANRAEFIGCITIVSEATAGQSRASVPRLLPRGTRFEGRIHEQPLTELPFVQLAVEFGHDGYNPHNQARKQGRNLALLSMALSSAPQDSYLLYQLGREYLAQDQAAKAREALEKSDRLSEPTAAFRHGLVVRLIQAQTRAGAFDAAFATIAAEEAHWRHSSDFWFATADTFLKSACPQSADALHKLQTAELCWKKCLEIGDGNLHGSIHGTGSYLAAGNLAELYQLVGHVNEADKYRRIAERTGAVSQISSTSA